MFSLTEITWQTKLVVFLAAAAVSFATGWRVHSWKTDAGIARSTAKTQKTAQTLQEKTAPIVDAGIQEKEVVRIIYRTIKEKIYEQNDQSVCFSNESLQLWNSAITAGQDQHRSESAAEVPSANSAAGEGDQEAGQRSDDVVATVEQVLINGAENFQTCKEDGIMHDKLIDVLNVYKGMMCVCKD